MSQQFDRIEALCLQIRAALRAGERSVEGGPSEAAIALRDEWEARWPKIMGDSKETEEFVEKLLAALAPAPSGPTDYEAEIDALEHAIYAMQTHTWVCDARVKAKYMHAMGVRVARLAVPGEGERK